MSEKYQGNPFPHNNVGEMSGNFDPFCNVREMSRESDPFTDIHEWCAAYFSHHFLSLCHNMFYEIYMVEMSNEYQSLIVSSLLI